MAQQQLRTSSLLLAVLRVYARCVCSWCLGRGVMLYTNPRRARMKLIGSVPSVVLTGTWPHSLISLPHGAPQ